MNNDELQKAIDDITKDNTVAEEAAPVAEPAMAADDLGQPAAEAVEPAPAAEPIASAEPMVEVELPAAPAPEVPAEPSMPPMAETPEVAPVEEITHPAEPIVEPVVETAHVAEPVVETVSNANDTLMEAMKELYPLLDKVTMAAEEKFDICMKVDDSQAAAKALEYAKQFTDDTAKANALLEIINKVK